MLRWSILLLTFVLWMGCMTAVYLHCRPPQSTDAQPGMQTALDAVFAADVEPKRAWLIYLAPGNEDGSDRSDRSGGARAWDGVDESSLQKIGWLLTTLNKRPNDFSRVEQVVVAEVTPPPSYPLAEKFGKMEYRSRADLSEDQGLENCSMTFKAAGIGLETNVLGVRENDELRLTIQMMRMPMQVQQFDQPPQQPVKLLDIQQRVPVGKRGAPNVGLFPFLDNRDVKVGYSWEIAMLDVQLALASNALDPSRPPLSAIKVRCTRVVEVKIEGTKISCFEVRTEDGKARAWYSADGVVLKQTFSFMDLVDVILVQVKPKEIAAETRGKLGN